MTICMQVINCINIINCFQYNSLILMFFFMSIYRHWIRQCLQYLQKYPYHDYNVYDHGKSNVQIVFQLRDGMSLILKKKRSTLIEYIDLLLDVLL